MKKFVIIGGGISGLSLAWFLKRRFGDKISLTIVEKENRLGGYVHTKRKDGFIFEQGARSCRSKGSGMQTLQLIEQLGLQDQVIAGDPSVKNRYLWIDKKLRSLPTGPFSFFTSSLMKGVIPALFKDLKTAPSSEKDESIYSFISRRFGSNIAETLIDPVTTGIYAGDIRQLSIKSCFPFLHEWEQAHGSVIKGAFKGRKKKRISSSKFVQEHQRASLFSLKDGIEILVHELAYRLREHLLLSNEATAFHFHPNKVEVDLKDGTILEADYLFSTIPASNLSSLFASHHKELSDLLASIPSISVAVVNLGYHKSVIKKRGFGYLIPSKEKENILGVVWDSSIFPQQNQIPEETRFTVMLGGAHFHNFDDLTSQECTNIALEAVSEHLRVDTPPDTISVKMAPKSIPQYLVGHAAKVEAIENILSRVFPRLTISGNSYYGVSFNDCIAYSKKLEENTKL
ncbi:MAG: Protoporphyrinogen oxidase [Chlamydiae bacterium]|nr:Protoporphyrinogen oxidase [Chlamydiota bacterium]